MDKFTFTTAGLEYAAQTTAGSVLEFTKGKYGSGSPPDDTMSLTDLVNPLGELALVSKSVTDSTVTVKTSFTNVVDGEILPAFHLTEVGLFARVLDTDGNEAEPETLVGYACVSGDDTGDYIANTPTEFVLNWPFSISNTDNVTVSVTMDAYALKEDVEQKADKVSGNGGFIAGTDASNNGGSGVAIGKNAYSNEAAVAIGTSASASEGGGAIGEQAYVSEKGGAVGRGAKATTGGAVGNGAKSGNGGAVGRAAETESGGAVGYGAVAGAGAAVGSNAKTTDADGNAIDAIQLGTGTNSSEKTFQVYDYQMMGADGIIPEERLGKNTAKIYVVSDLPSSSAEYDFSDGVSQFVTGYRTACSAESDTDNGGYYQKITNSGNSNTYRTAVFDCTGIMVNATAMTVEFDTSMTGRWHISLADLSLRPGESTGSTYTDAGCAFSIGSTDGSNLKVYGADGTMTLSGWKHVKAVLDFSAKTVDYTVTDRSDGSVLQTGTISFRDTDVTEISGFEAYTWSASDLLIDNISIVTLIGAKENSRYLVKNGDVYDEYQYINGEPVKLSNSGDALTADALTADVLTAKTYAADSSSSETMLGNFTLLTPRINQYEASGHANRDYYLGYYVANDVECAPDSNGQYTPFDSTILNALSALGIVSITVQAALNNAITPYEYLRGTIHIDVKTNTAKVYAADGTVLTSGTYYAEGLAVFDIETEE